MVSTGLSSTTENHQEEEMEAQNSNDVENQEDGKGSSFSFSSGEAVAQTYEEKRAQRMQENMERMKKLGILELSKNLKKKTAPSSTKKKKMPSKAASSAINDPPRRSSRLVNMTPVSYSEKRPKKEERTVRLKEIDIERGLNPEVYTEEQEKLLGDCKNPWTLLVDGYDSMGQRIYDPYEGKSCHQCRQKTLGHRTKCSKCKSLSGQLCGDCLYMRYGENVLEVKENPDWICPVCRGICNCSRCRREKGWAPTGAIYRQVAARGFKSVAHYLIKTLRSGTKSKEEGNEVVLSSDGSFMSSDEMAEATEETSTIQANADGSGTEEEEEELLVESDEDHEEESNCDSGHVNAGKLV